MVNEQFSPIFISRKSSYSVIDRDNVGIEGMNEIIKGFKGDISPHVETSISALRCANAFIWMVFRVSMYGNMAFIQLHDHIIR